jgi:hypothetical protein
MQNYKVSQQIYQQSQKDSQMIQKLTGVVEALQDEIMTQNSQI